MSRGVWALCLLAGCRFHFDPRRLSDGATMPDAAPADAAITPHLVQVVAPNYADQTSLVASISVTAGDLLVAATYWDTGNSAITVTDSTNLAWQALPLANIATGCGPPAGGSSARLWFAAVPATGAVDVTVAQGSDTSPLGMRLLEYAGVDGLDTSSSLVPTTPSNAMTTGTLATTGPDLVVALFCDTLGMGTMTAGSGWTLRSIETPFYTLVEDDAPGAPAGSIDPAAALPAGVSDACWVGVAAAFHAP